MPIISATTTAGITMTRPESAPMIRPVIGSRMTDATATAVASASPGRSLRTIASALAVRIAVTPLEEALFAIGGRRAPGLVPAGIAAN